MFVHFITRFSNTFDDFKLSIKIFPENRNKKDLKKIAGRKPNIKQGPEVLYHELPIMFVNANYNNTMFTITDHQGMYAFHHLMPDTFTIANHVYFVRNCA